MGVCVSGFRKDLLLWAQAVILSCGSCSSFPAFSFSPARSLKKEVQLSQVSLRYLENLYEGVRRGLKVKCKRFVEEVIKLQLLRS